MAIWPFEISTPARFDPEAHRYYDANDRPIVGVSEALGQLRNFSGISPEILEEAAARGTLVHAITARMDLGFPVTIPDLVAGYVAAWSKFRSEFGGDAVLVEQQVYHRDRGYAGTLDRVFAREGKRGQTEWHLVDLKTTATISDVDGLQTALYMSALLSIGKAIKMRRWTVQLRADGTYNTQEWKSPSDLAYGLSCVSLQRWRIDHGIA